MGPPKIGKWNVTGVDGLIIAQMAVQLHVMYNGTNKQVQNIIYYYYCTRDIVDSKLTLYL